MIAFDVVYSAVQSGGRWTRLALQASNMAVPRVGDVVKVHGSEIPVDAVVWDLKSGLIEVQLRPQVIVQEFATFVNRMAADGWKAT